MCSKNLIKKFPTRDLAMAKLTLGEVPLTSLNGMGLRLVNGLLVCFLEGGHPSKENLVYIIIRAVRSLK